MLEKSFVLHNDLASIRRVWPTKKQKVLVHFSISPVCKMLIAEKDKQGPDLVIPVWVRPELEPDVDKGDKGDKVDQICPFELVNNAVDFDIDQQCGF